MSKKARKFFTVTIKIIFELCFVKCKNVFLAKKISQEEDRTKRIWSKVAMLLEAADDQGEENLERQLDLLIALKK